MGGPAVLNLAHVSGASVAMWDTYEASFDLDTVYPNPYADEEIEPGEVWVRTAAQLQSPSGRVLSWPCFYMQDYTEIPGNPSTYTLSGSPKWRLRACFDEVGTWIISVTGEDDTGFSETSPFLTVTVNASSRRGVMRRKDHVRVTADGHQLWLFGNNYGTNEGAATLDGAALIARDASRVADNGGNVGRFVPLPRAGTMLEWTTTATALGRSDWYEGLGKMSQKPAKRTDVAMFDAKSRGIYVIYCLNVHEALRYDVLAGGAENIYMSWHASSINGGKHPYSVGGGGWITNTTPEAFFTDVKAKAYDRRKARYIMARWGGFENVAWDLCNEADQVGNIDLSMTGHSDRGTTATNMNAWHVSQGKYLRSIDPHRRIIEHSYANASYALSGVATAFQDLDVAQHHHYENDEVKAVSWAGNFGATEVINTYGRIFSVGEWGISPQGAEAEFDPLIDPTLNPTNKWDTTAERDRLIEGVDTHNIVCAMMVLGADARRWYWETYMIDKVSRNRGVPTFPMHQWYAKIKPFIAGEDWANLKPQPVPTSITYDTTNLFACGSKTTSRFWAFVRNQQYDYGDTTAMASLTNRTGKTLTVTGMDVGSYHYEIWNTRPGLNSASPAIIVATGTTSVGSGTLVVKLPDFTKSFLVKARLRDGSYN